YQWSEGKQPEKKGASYMAGYDIGAMVKPTKEQAYIQTFFTRKGKDLFCIVPAYSPQLRLTNLKLASTTKANILAGNRHLSWKQVGTDAVIDLSNLKPGDVPAEMFVIKLQNAL
ncbi:MAG: alpha-L-fucosidase, partial [Bacteroidota bacterium]|nr:alpha-L-fucosidase [Bacteroidota bacterium]